MKSAIKCESDWEKLWIELRSITINNYKYNYNYNYNYFTEVANSKQGRLALEMFRWWQWRHMVPTGIVLVEVKNVKGYWDG